MSKRLWGLLLGAALLALALFTSAAAEDGLAAPSTAGKLRVEGTQLVGSDGQSVQLRGVSTHGLAWFPQYVNREWFHQLRTEWKGNAVRLAMYTAESGGYCTGGDRDALRQLIRDGVRYATEEDLYVIVDWHILSDNNPNIYLDEAKAFFDEMTAEFAGHDNVLYEICNEPNSGTPWSEVKRYAEEVIPVIRSHDEDAIILVGTPNWSQFVDEAAADPITGYDNIMYTLHFYASTHRDDLRARMVKAIEDGLPVFVSEYGICDASGNGAIDEAEADRWVEAMDAHGVSYMMWSFCNKNESASALAPNCTKTSGFTAEDLSTAGRWLYRHLSGETPEDAQPAPEAEEAAPMQAAAAAEPDVLATIDCGNGLQAVAVLRGQWEADGKPVYQYDVTVKNTADADCASWEIALPFDGEFSLSDGWNGNYTAEGETLRIANMPYNGAIAAGSSVRDVGFIVSGACIRQP